MIRVLVPLILTGLLVFAIVDVIVIDNGRVRGLPKFAWIMVVIILPLIGPLLWFFLGRERLDAPNHGRYVNDPAPVPEPGRRLGPIAPDDDPDFLGRLNREQEQEERIRELEKRLKDLDDDKPKD